MPRTPIFAEQFPDPEVATALKEHRADRAALLASFTASLQADMRVRAAWLWGSFGRGEADDLSDLDPWIVVTEDAAGEMGKSLRLYAARTGSLITGGEAPRNGPPGGGFFGCVQEGRHGLLHLDCYWQPQSAQIEVPEIAVLFHRLEEPIAAPFPSLPPQEQTTLSPEDEPIVDGIDFAWLMLSIAAKTLARDPASDMALMLYPRPGLEDAAMRLGLDDVIAPADWTVPESPLQKVEYLRHLGEKTARLTQAALEKGLELSPRNAVCLVRYLDMVEGILRSSVPLP